MTLQWERPLFDLLARLEEDPDGVSDLDVRTVIRDIDGHLQTNCDSAAQHLFFAIAPICTAKPHLAGELLVHAVRPLYYLGVETSAEATDWVRHFLAKKQSYMAPSGAGRRWLEDLLLDPSPLQVALSEVATAEAAGDLPPATR